MEMQRSAILRMLNIGGDQTGPPSNWTWKVLVYDKFCLEAVAPLLRIGALRNYGVTLQLNINNDRQPQGDVPAVYFLEPTEDNIKMIKGDLAKGLYESCYINFASAVPRPLLEELARGALEAKAPHKVAGVFDRYVSFVSLSSSLFSLNLPETYRRLNSPSSDDQFIEQLIERIVDGLISVVITMRSCPVIRCPTEMESPVAAMVAQRLEARIRELLTHGGAQASDLFSAPSSAGVPRPGADGAAGQRPLLCILNRDVDLISMLLHTWTYQAMAHDVFGMRLNKLTVPVDAAGGDGAAPPKPKTYDIDESDAFWAANCNEPFSQVGVAVHEAIEEYHKKSEEMTKSGEEDPNASLAPGLAQAINALPEMADKKRSIDMHTNIATALLNEIKARELDAFYTMEDQFSSKSTSTCISEIEARLSSGQKGTLMDKTRALMVLYLSKQSMTPEQIQKITDALEKAGGDASGLAYLQQLAKVRNIAATMSGSGGNSSSTSPGSSIIGNFGNFSSLTSSATGFFAAGVNNLKNVVASKKESPLCQIFEGLMEQKTTGVTENYLYLDPKAPPYSAGGEVARQRAPFRRGIAFVIGGGNYTELQSLQEWAEEKGRQIFYGSTDVVSPIQFVEELCHLGRAEGGGK